MESVFDNGGIIGQTMDFTNTEQYIVGNTLTNWLSYTYNGIVHQNSPGSTSTTFTVSTGSPSATDWIVVVIHMEASNPTSYGVTIDGKTAIIAANANIGSSGTTDTQTLIAYATGITSSTVNVVFSYNDTGTQYRNSCASYTLSGENLAVESSESYYPDSGTTTNFSSTVVENGLIIYGATLGDETNTDNWSGITELYNMAHPENNASLSGGIYVPTVSGTYTGASCVTTGSEIGLVAVSFSGHYNTTLYGNQKNSGIWSMSSIYNSLLDFVPLALTENLSSFYPLSSDGTDIIGGYNLTATNVSYINDATYGYVADFSADSSYFSGTGIPLANRDFSFSVWTRADGSHDTSNANYIFSQGSSGSTGTALHFAWAKTNKYRFSFYGTSTDLDSNATFTSSDSIWKHWVCTFDNTTKVLTIYLNGSYDISKTGISFTGNSTTKIGMQGWNTNGGWDGQIRNLRIYTDKVLTSEDVDSIYNYELVH